MGLLDFMNSDEARSGINLLAAASPSMQPMGFGERLALAMRMNDEQQRRSLEEQMRKEQMRLVAQRADREQKLQDFMASRLGLGAPPPGAMGGTMPSGSMGEPPSGSMPGPMGQAPGPMQQGPGGTFPLGLNDIAALNVMGAPGADKLLDMYKYANDGSKREAGNYYVNPMNGQTTFMPKIPEGATITQDGRIIPMPGASDTNAAYKGAETLATERAKAGLDTVSIPMPDGSTRTVRRDQAASLLGGQAAPAGFGVSQSPADRTYADDAAKLAGEQYKQMQNAGMLAPGQIAKYQQLGQMLADHDGGKLSSTALGIAQTANSLGLKIDKNLSNKEAAQKLTNELALALRNPSGGEGMPGAMSDADREFLMKSVPNMSQSAEGRNKMIQIQVGLLQRQQKVAEMARKWQQRGGRIDATDPQGRSFQDMLQKWANENPMFAQ